MNRVHVEPLLLSDILAVPFMEELLIIGYFAKKSARIFPLTTE